MRNAKKEVSLAESERKPLVRVLCIRTNVPDERYKDALETVLMNVDKPSNTYYWQDRKAMAARDLLKLDEIIDNLRIYGAMRVFHPDEKKYRDFCKTPGINEQYARMNIDYETVRVGIRKKYRKKPAEKEEEEKEEEVLAT